MELRHLRCFLAVAEELHFGRAARRLNLSQPPVSRQIRDLEAEMGVPLFTRDRRRVALTREGHLLVTEARRALAGAERFERVARQLRDGERGLLRVGYVHSALYGAVPAILRAYRQESPRVELVIRELVTSELVRSLLDDDIDVAFVRPPVSEPALDLLVLREEPLVAAVPADHPAARMPALRLADLAADPFVVFPRALGPGFWDLIVHACGAAGFSPRILYEASEIHTMVGLVAAGSGVALVPEPVRRLALDGVRYVPLQDPRPALRLALVWHREWYPPTLERFVEVAREMGP